MHLYGLSVLRYFSNPVSSTISRISATDTRHIVLAPRMPLVVNFGILAVCQAGSGARNTTMGSVAGVIAILSGPATGLLVSINCEKVSKETFRGRLTHSIWREMSRGYEHAGSLRIVKISCLCRGDVDIVLTHLGSCKDICQHQTCETSCALGTEISKDGKRRHAHLTISSTFLACNDFINLARCYTRTLFRLITFRARSTPQELLTFSAAMHIGIKITLLVAFVVLPLYHGLVLCPKPIWPRLLKVVRRSRKTLRRRKRRRMRARARVVEGQTATEMRPLRGHPPTAAFQHRLAIERPLLIHDKPPGAQLRPREYKDSVLKRTRTW